MEEKKKNVVPMNAVKEPTNEELKAQLMQAQQMIAGMRQDFQKKLESINYTNAFQQQQFMLEIVKMHDIFPSIIVEKAIDAINNFWFEDQDNEKERGDEKQG